MHKVLSKPRLGSRSGDFYLSNKITAYQILEVKLNSIQIYLDPFVGMERTNIRSIGNALWEIYTGIQWNNSSAAKRAKISSI